MTAQKVRRYDPEIKYEGMGHMSKSTMMEYDKGRYIEYADVARYRHLGIKYLEWLGVKNPEESIEKDMCDPSMFGGSNLTARSTR